ncbi:MAG: hypothetical protein ACRDA3_00885 [Peptostreptococcaceae bacterium]
MITLVLLISLFNLGCSQNSLSVEYPNKIIIKYTQGKEVEIIDKKEVENFDYILQYGTLKELKSVELDFNSDISIVEEYKSSKTKSREIYFDKDSKNIKLVINGEYIYMYGVEAKIYNEIYDSISARLYN